MAAAKKNIEAAITENVIDITNILEAFVRSEKYEMVPNNLEDLTATEPVVNIIDRTNSALLIEVMTSEVRKRLQEIKEYWTF